MENQTPKPSPTPPTENIPVQNPAVAETPPQVYTAPHIDNPPPKKPFLTGKIILIVIILSVILSAGGTYLALNSKPKPQPTVPKVTPTTTPTPVDETANWKTFTSTKWGFKFKYPNDWTIAKEGDKGVVIIENDSGYGTPEVDFYVLEDSAAMTASRNKIKSYPVNKDVHVPLDNSEGAVRSYDIYKRLEDKNVDNYTALRYTIDLGYKDVGVSDVYEASILKGVKIITVRMIFNPLVNNKSESKVDFIDKILSTFKFTDTSPTPTCRPRPACLDATPRCLIPETPDMCRPSATPPPDGGGIVCTQDAKLCPDGKTYVGRQGPKCEFAACPGNP